MVPLNHCKMPIDNLSVFREQERRIRENPQYEELLMRLVYPNSQTVAARLIQEMRGFVINPLGLKPREIRERDNMAFLVRCQALRDAGYRLTDDDLTKPSFYIGSIYSK